MCTDLLKSVKEFTKNYRNMNAEFLFEKFSTTISKIYNDNNKLFNVDDLDIDIVSYNSFGEEHNIDLKSVFFLKRL
jgi:hypothetical protein